MRQFPRTPKGARGPRVLHAIKRPNELPVVNVVALVLIALSVIPVYLAQRVSGEAAGVTR